MGIVFYSGAYDSPKNPQLLEFEPGTFPELPNALPVAICQDITVSLDASGSYSLAASEIDAGSSDADGPVSLAVSPNTFDCTHTSSNQSVTLTVTDGSSTTATCAAFVTVKSVVASCATEFEHEDVNTNVGQVHLTPR